MKKVSKIKRIGFRVDANEHIASGHLMRCIAIALECKRIGDECIFFLAEEKYMDRLIQKQIPYRILCSKWNDMESEKEKLIELLVEEKIDTLVIDSYQATKTYLEDLDKVLPVLYIDDMAKEIYDVSMLLHYSGWSDDNWYEERYVGKRTQILYGMKYVPLRQEFSEKCEKEKREKCILITTGGTDPYNIAGKVAEELMEQEYCKDYVIKIIVGGMNCNIESLKQLQEKDSRIRLLYNVNNMGELMRTSECTVSAGGTTLFELCACQVPTVCFSFAENQVKFCKELDGRNVMLYAGDARFDLEIQKRIVDGIMLFLIEKGMRDAYKARMRALVDGKGALRIAKVLLNEVNRQ